MWSSKVALSFIFTLNSLLEIGAKTYYFNVNKTSNEFLIYNRVNLNNSATHYPSPVHVSELRNNVTRWKTNTNVTYTHPLIDPEWDYNWRNMTRHKLPSYIQKFYESVSDEGTHFGPIRIMFNALSRNSTVIQFNLSDINVHENVSDVELHFHLIVDKNLTHKSLILRLYQMENDHFNGSSLINPDAHKLLNVIYILQAEDGWQIFKITNTIQEWLEERRDLKLFITISRPNENQFSLFKDVNKDIFRTFIIIQTQTERETTPQVDDASPSDPCRVHDMYIDFEKLNWMKFIISPPGYNARNCYGRCYKHNELPNHLKIANFIAEIARKSLCCVPVSYTPLPIMFYDKNGNVRVKIYDKMIISSCGCR